MLISNKTKYVGAVILKTGVPKGLSLNLCCNMLIYMLLMLGKFSPPDKERERTTVFLHNRNHYYS